jgi:glucose-6-phosphate 1-dehydrogenase
LKLQIDSWRWAGVPFYMHTGKRMPSTGYETLIYHCMIGDATLFKRADNIELGWAILGPVLDAWTAQPAAEFPNYDAGTWGPSEAEHLLTRDGRAWHAKAS